MRAVFSLVYGFAMLVAGGFPGVSSALRRLGSAEVFPFALGCAGMSGSLGQAMDDAESIATIHEAIERGVNVLDTADFYGYGHNELLIGKAIKDRREKVVLSVKFDALRSPQGAFLGMDARAEAVKNFLGYTLTRLGVDYVDVYRPARLDPKVPIEETVGAISEMVKAGYVRHIGLSEVGAETIRRAQTVHPIADVQLEYSLMSRKPEEEIVPVLKELGIAMTAYGVLSHGLLTGNARPAGEGDGRAHLPRLKGENFEKNKKLADGLKAFSLMQSSAESSSMWLFFTEKPPSQSLGPGYLQGKCSSVIAREKGVTTSQLAIAWVLARGADFVPVVGSRKRGQLQESLGALAIELSAEDVARMERAVPADEVAGTRYDERLMKMLDSEKGS